MVSYTDYQRTHGVRAGDENERQLGNRSLQLREEYSRQHRVAVGQQRISRIFTVLQTEREKHTESNHTM